MASICACEAPMPTYEQGVSIYQQHGCLDWQLARTHPVIAAPQLVHFSLLVPPDNRLPGLRCCEMFFSKYISDVRNELGYEVITPVTIQVACIDNLGYSFVARRHCGGLPRPGSLQTTSSARCTFCLSTDTLPEDRYSLCLYDSDAFLAFFWVGVINFREGLFLR